MGSNAYLFLGALAFASGIFLRSFFVVPVFEVVVCIVVIGVFAFLVRRHVATMVLVVLIILFGFGYVRSAISDTEVEPIEEKIVVVEGVVSDEPDLRDTRTLLTITTEMVDAVEVRHKILASVDRGVAVSYGDRVVLRGTLTLPQTFESDYGRVFDYPKYLLSKGIEYTLSFATLESKTSESFSFFGVLYNIKHSIMRAIESVLPEPYAGLSEGLLLGVKRAIGENLEQIFRTTGIIHIVVLSGYNIALVADVIMRVLKMFFAIRTRIIFGVVGILLFAGMVGFSATVVRASLMACLVLFARATGRTYDALRALVLVGVCMLVWNPLLLVYDPGFQFSFLATLGLLVASERIEKHLVFIPQSLQLRSIAGSTVATYVAILPILLYSIGQFSLVSVLVNMLVLPAVAPAMLLSFIAAISYFVFAPLGMLVGFCAYLVLSYIVAVAEFFAAIPYASFMVPPFPFWVVALVYGGLAGVLVAYTKTAKARAPSRELPFA